jgi:hypothetical protein
MPKSGLGRALGTILIVLGVALVIFFFAAVVVLGVVLLAGYFIRRMVAGLRSRPAVPGKEVTANAGALEVPAKYEVLNEGEK